MDYQTRCKFMEELKSDKSLDFKDKRFLSSIGCADSMLQIQKEKVKEYQQLVEMNHVLFIFFFALHFLMKSHSMVYYAWIIMIAFNSRFSYVINRVYSESDDLNEVYYRSLHSHLVNMKKKL